MMILSDTRLCSSMSLTGDSVTCRSSNNYYMDTIYKIHLAKLLQRALLVLIQCINVFQMKFPFIIIEGNFKSNQIKSKLFIEQITKININKTR